MPISAKNKIMAPIKSNGCFSACSAVGRTFKAHIKAIMPIGILIRKMLCHPKMDVKNPPKTGPI